MKRKSIVLLVILVLSLLAIGSVQASMPSFGPALYADGQVFASTGLTPLPAPTTHNAQSFDKLFVFTNGAEGQLSVAEAAPGNPSFNGGRWATHVTR